MKTYNTDGLKLIQSIESNSIDLILTEDFFIKFEKNQNNYDFIC